MSDQPKAEAVRSSGHVANAWLRALELTAPIARNRDRILPLVVAQMAEQRGDAPGITL